MKQFICTTKKNKGTKSGKEGIYLKRTTLFACANDCRCYYETIHLHTIKTTKAHMSWDETIYLKRKKIAHANDGRCYYETIQLHPTKTTKAQNSWEDTIYRKLKKSCVATMKTIRLHEKKTTTKAHMSWDETIYLKRKNCARQQIAVAIMKTIRLQQKIQQRRKHIRKKRFNLS